MPFTRGHRVNESWTNRCFMKVADLFSQDLVGFRWNGVYAIGPSGGWFCLADRNVSRNGQQSHKPVFTVSAPALI